MAKNPLKFLRFVLAVALALCAPGLPSYAAAAQVVSARSLAVSSPFGAAGAARHRVLVAPIPLSSLSLSPSLVLSPVLKNPSLTPLPAPTPVLAEAAPAPAQRPALGGLIEAVHAEAPNPSAVFDLRLDRLFDGVNKRPSISGVELVGTSRANSVRPAVLTKAFRQDALKSQALPNVVRQQAKSKGLSRIGKALLIAAFLLAVPTLALAAGAPAAAVGVSASMLVSIQPLASGIAAVLGAVYGMIAAHRKGEPKPSAGQILTSILRYGILGGAGIYVLLDVTQIFFFGLSAVKPLSSAVAAAAFGQSAFHGKFAEASTTPADRIIRTFPAIASALGLSIGLILTSSFGLQTLALGALSITGVSSAVYAALFKPGKSFAEGPSVMARGYVLQTLMTGLALAVSGPYLAAACLALAAWGFWNVLSTVLREAESNLPDSLRKLWRRNK